MGSYTILDIIASFVIAGAVMLMIHKTNGFVRQTNLTTGSDLTVQKNLVTVVGMLEKDLRRIGYCATPFVIADPQASIKTATSHSFKFITDVDNNGRGDGTVDTVEYTISDSLVLGRTPNKSDKMLYRKVTSPNSGSRSNISMSVGLTRFDFVYLDLNDNIISLPIAVGNLGQIRSIQLSVELENPFPYDTVNTYAYWRQVRLAAKNLNTR
jgi:hypothetical protein